VKNGNSLMSSFSGTLTNAQIDDVAAFIVDSRYS